MIRVRRMEHIVRTMRVVGPRHTHFDHVQREPFLVYGTTQLFATIIIAVFWSYPPHVNESNPAAKASDTTSSMERARELAVSTLAMTSFPRLQHWFLGREVNFDVLHWRSLQHPKNYDAARLHEASNSTFPLCRSPTGADIRLITRISPRSSACTLPPPDFPRQTVRSWKWKSCENGPCQDCQDSTWPTLNLAISG